MGRLPLVDPGDVGASSLAREALAAAWAARGRSADPNVYQALASHPRALRKLVEFGTVANFDNSMTPGAARDWLRDGALTDAGRAARADIEDRTDAAEQAIVAALGGRLDEVCARLGGWGERCITARAFPADILKRAAG